MTGNRHKGTPRIRAVVYILIVVMVTHVHISFKTQTVHFSYVNYLNVVDLKMKLFPWEVKSRNRVHLAQGHIS